MTRTKKSTKSYRHRLPSCRVSVSSIGDETDRRFYRVLKIIKDRCDPSQRSTVFDPVLSSAEAASHARTLLRVEKGVFHGHYTGKPWRFIKHANEALNHILTSRSKKCKLHLQALEFKDIFGSQMDELMKGLGYCCGHWYTQEARRVSCTGIKGCVVPEGEEYFRYCEWTYCSKCFNNFPDDVINHETMLGHRAIHKGQFQRYYFMESRPERFVYCELCRLKFHEVCVLHSMFNFDPFFCDKCRNKEGIPKITVRASNLPQTECDIFVNKFLQSRDINLDDKIIIRLLSEMDQTLIVPEKFKKVRGGPGKIEYSNCTLFTFFDTGKERDVCFFSVFFQLFGDCCQESNRNTAYISYIDSVNFLPENRTLVYRLVLLGLFAFLKTKGCNKIYLWSCPTSGNNDYIFYRKPAKMKMPTSARLAKWYTELLIMGTELGVIVSYTGILEAAEDINGLPFMEGDLWVTRLDEAIKSIEKVRSKDLNDIRKLKKKLTQETQLGKITEIRGQMESLRLKLLKGYGTRLWELLTVQIRGMNSQYFVIHLGKDGKRKKESLTGDKLARSRSWLNDRHLFMDFFCGHILEFSTERRAQYSTFVMLWRLFVENGMCVMCRTQTRGGVTGEGLCTKCYSESHLLQGAEGEEEVDDVVSLSESHVDLEGNESLGNSAESLLESMEIQPSTEEADVEEVSFSVSYADLGDLESLGNSTETCLESMEMQSCVDNAASGPSEPSGDQSDIVPQVNSPIALKTSELVRSLVHHLRNATQNPDFQEPATVDITPENSPGALKAASSDSGIESMGSTPVLDTNYNSKWACSSSKYEPGVSIANELVKGEPRPSVTVQETRNFATEEVIIDSDDSEIEFEAIRPTGWKGGMIEIDLTKPPVLKQRKFSRDYYEILD